MANHADLAGAGALTPLRLKRRKLYSRLGPRFKQFIAPILRVAGKQSVVLGIDPAHDVGIAGLKAHHLSVFVSHKQKHQLVKVGEAVLVQTIFQK